MSLIQPNPSAPLAAEEKSLDKLEIELEEQEQVITIEPTDESKAKDERQEKSTEKKGEEGPKSLKSPRRPLLNIKIPQILKKRPKDPSQQQQQKPSVTKDDNKGQTEKSIPEEKEPEIPGVKGEVAIVLETSNGSLPPSEAPPPPPPVTPLPDSSSKNGTTPTGKDKIVNVNSVAPSPVSSFITSFSTPKWTNFRRVFSFNRSAPTPILMHQEPRSEGEERDTVLLSPSDENTFSKAGEGKDKENGDSMVQETTPETKRSRAPNGSNTYLVTPLIRLFRVQRGPRTLKDLESGEVVAELLEKNPRSTIEGDTMKSKDVEQGVTDETTKADGGGKDEAISKGPETVAGENPPVNKTSMNGDGHSYGFLKPNPELWRQRIMTRLSNLNKWICVGIWIFFALIAIILGVSVLTATRSIDIGTVIVDGKYISTITSCGHIQGVIEDGGYSFRGIPYALPPVGVLRWKQAETHHHLSHCWNGTYLAHNHSIPCWQFYRNGSYDGSEDCLYLDLYTPKVYYDAPVPVVVFIGGESLNGGESSALKPSAALAVEHNVVFVSVSIRRSVMGFLSLDILSQFAYPSTSGNYGLSDLIAALKWVHYNVDHFGGDPNRVTLLGHSSGATLASALLDSDLSKGLVHQVWISGGSPSYSIMNLQEAQKLNEKFLTEIDCTTIECLHNKGPEELLQSVPYDWRSFNQDLPQKGEQRHHWLVRDGIMIREPLVDNSLPTQPLQVRPNKIPVVAGAPAEIDASSEMFSYLDWNDTSRFSVYLESKLGSFGPSLSREVIDRYFRPEATPWQQFAALLSDVRTICPLYYTTMERADPFVSTPTYFYVVTQRKETSMGFVADANADLAVIFGLYDPQTREEMKFNQNFKKLFYDFVETGIFSNGQDVTKSIYIVDENIQKIFTYPNCDFWHEHHFYPNYSRID